MGRESFIVRLGRGVWAAAGCDATMKYGSLCPVGHCSGAQDGA
ncbi:hypothetical protein ATPR_0393 [Acetobacter tropicalis NBRC 101654]|uniref:Uncharacterized protein n=1 Tax=Acetobacter tropicalis NBRC 101654 TaxID=749388 RepID=F7VAJ4_9PROT|nr:hypothetical protein ATPR_0393 [Acetobacter tropicalis NBRC 101654]